MQNAFDIETIENPSPTHDTYYSGAMELLSKTFGDAKNMQAELARHNRTLLQVAHTDGKVLGFKLGYEEKPDRFYSWLGAVDPSARKQGVGHALMEAQHDWCKKQGYKKVQTRTKNSWRDMLILNLKCGFDVIGTYTDDKGDPKIILEKKL